MLADAPQYHYQDHSTRNKPKDLKTAKKLTNQNAKEMMEYFKGLSGG
ncbi:hypothetical protein [Emticicia agri]|nr:hypothetical protein [Emticicia agri]